MSANLETLAKELMELGYSEEVITPIWKAARTKGLPSSIQLVRLQHLVENGASIFELGLEAREIAMSDLAHVLYKDVSADNGGIVTGANAGEIWTQQSSLLAIASYNLEGESRLVGEPGRLAITIQEIRDDEELERATREGRRTKIRAVAINTNVLSGSDFADVYRLQTETAGLRTFAKENPFYHKPGNGTDFELARLLVSRIKESPEYQQLQK
jgi:hypothetical protein